MIRVIYKSKRNNKKLAEAIADELHVKAEKLEQVKDLEADILFLGCAILGGKVAHPVTEFVAKMDCKKVKKVILFSSNGYGTDQFEILKEQLKEKKIIVGPVFSCKGNAFIFMNRGKPDQKDLQLVRAFAKKSVHVN